MRIARYVPSAETFCQRLLYVLSVSRDRNLDLDHDPDPDCLEPRRLG